MDRERRFKKHVVVVAEATKAYIEKNPLTDKTTNQFAMEANISRKQLQAAFKELTGMGIQEYLLAKRMQHARKLLQTGITPIKEIASTCRYGTQRSFTTAFKKHIGLTPAEYRYQHSW
jgi:AraC-like DNA-binding protein